MTLLTIKEFIDLAVKFSFAMIRYLDLFQFLGAFFFPNITLNVLLCFKNKLICIRVHSMFSSVLFRQNLWLCLVANHEKAKKKKEFDLLIDDIQIMRFKP